MIHNYSPENKPNYICYVLILNFMQRINVLDKHFSYEHHLLNKELDEILVSPRVALVEINRTYYYYQTLIDKINCVPGQ